MSLSGQQWQLVWADAQDTPEWKGPEHSPCCPQGTPRMCPHRWERTWAVHKSSGSCSAPTQWVDWGGRLEILRGMRWRPALAEPQGGHKVSTLEEGITLRGSLADEVCEEEPQGALTQGPS